MKTVLLTGATNGIGYETLIKLLNKNYFVHGTYVKDVNKAMQLSKKFNNLKLYQVDLSNRSETGLFLDTIQSIKFDAIINNAGFYTLDTLDNTDLKEWDRMVEGMLTSPILIIRKLHNQLNPNSSIINICSIYGSVIFPNDSLGYLAAKAGLQAVTKALSVSFKGKGIRVNGIAPGITDTTISGGQHLDEETKKMIIEQTPLQEVCKPEDIANIVSFLLEENSKFINGEILVVDGGHTNYNNFFSI